MVKGFELTYRSPLLEGFNGKVNPPSSHLCLRETDGCIRHRIVGIPESEKMGFLLLKFSKSSIKSSLISFFFMACVCLTCVNQNFI